MTEEGVSFIVPVRNGESRLPALLESIRRQRYPHTLIEIIVVDDDSTDATRAVASGFGAKVVRHDAHDCERGKAIGLEAAMHDLVVFVDDDNVLPGDDWLGIALSSLQHFSCAGVQPARFHYDRSDTPANRYQSIFGGTDPVVFYLRRSDRLSAWADGWGAAGKIVDQNDEAWLVQFSASCVPTLGAQGFVTRKSVLQRTAWTPLYFHIDVCEQLVGIGLNRFAMLKRPIVHHHCDGFGEMLAKLRRNFRRFLRDNRTRTYRYDTAPVVKAKTALVVGTGLVPAVVSLRAFIATRDPVSFVHPLICIATAALYAYELSVFVIEKMCTRLVGSAEIAL